MLTLGLDNVTVFQVILRYSSQVSQVLPGIPRYSQVSGRYSSPVFPGAPRYCLVVDTCHLKWQVSTTKLQPHLSPSSPALCLLSLVLHPCQLLLLPQLFEPRRPQLSILLSASVVEYSVQCTMYSVHCTLYTVQCTEYSVQSTVYSVH